MSDRSRKLGPRVTVSVAPVDYDTLNTLAEKDDVSVSWIVRRAIHEYLRRHQQPERAVRRSTLEKRSAAPERP
ncbi:ribbon-helix-helix protein, CopG family [Sphingomonas psychrotolerans]|uniref:Ribbon-helix-helix protein, CopG family n=1 Tax=Sphingomonas psychrotolerans TaxID=1327635 RepID=A0ABU3N7W8_9SPHN|nr:ribbon-helix-helix protein, CopG family [Sphingomonas psychrotolerans]MDT8760548.1 ribbon-helix-helix protein, CopG family [Sphingomonas psychrotolerans]